MKYLCASLDGACELDYQNFFNLARPRDVEFRPYCRAVVEGKLGELQFHATMRAITLPGPTNPARFERSNGRVNSSGVSACLSRNFVGSTVLMEASGGTPPFYLARRRPKFELLIARKFD
jgi:hypothetical protein